MTSCICKSCFGCIKLRIGCLLIGYLLLASKLIRLVVNTVYICRLPAFIKLRIDYIMEAPFQLFIAEVLVIEVIVTAELIFVGMLLAGLYQRNPTYLRLFYILSAVSYVVDGIMSVVRYCYFGLSFVNNFYLSVFIAHIILKVLTPYFLLVVRSYYFKSRHNGIGIVHYASA